MIAFVSALLVLALPATALASPVNPVPLPSVTFNGPVRSAVVWGEAIYVGGDFTSATVNGVRFPRQRLAAVGRSSGALLDWKPSADLLVTAVAADATGVYVAGDFAYVNGVKRDSLAKLDLSTGGLLSLSHKIYGHVKTIAAANGRLYAGGTITSIDGIARKGAAAFSAITGALDGGWAPAINGTVNTLLPTADRVYVGGKFDNINNSSGTQKVAAVRPDTGVVDPGFVSKISSMIHDLHLSGDTLYAGVDGNGGKATAMTLSGVPKWTVSTDGDVQAIAELDGAVYLGGHFDAVCKSANLGDKGTCLDGKDVRIKLAAVDTAGKLLDWTANGNGTVGVHAIVSDPARGQLLVCGEFTTINGAAQKRFALFRLPV